MFTNFLRLSARKLTTTAESVVERYPAGVQALHWLSGGAMVGAVGLILHVQSLPSWQKCNPEEKSLKMRSMFFHKSCGALAMSLIFPRIAIRLASKVPPSPEGHMVEQMAGECCVFHLNFLSFLLLSLSLLSLSFLSLSLSFFFNIRQSEPRCTLWICTSHANHRCCNGMVW